MNVKSQARRSVLGVTSRRTQSARYLEHDLQKLDLRAGLRHGTAHIHERLDAAVGEFTDRASYGRYLQSTYRFRAALEPALMAGAPWPVQSLLADLRRDLADLELPMPAATPPAPRFEGTAAQIGALYVLEGSGLGARLLLRRAEAIGFDEDFGARHLAHQTGDKSRWRRFIALLEAAEDIDPARALAGAHAAFEIALSLYAEKISERS